jgi:pimeloyl-ACP methyl ester carboxylesterase
MANTQGTVLFIHGMLVGPACWQGWVRRYEAAGYRCHALAWPQHEGDPAELRRRHPDPQLGRVTLPDIVSHHERFIASLPEPPILVGHSMGGNLVQILLSKGLGKVGVAVDSAPAAGVFVLSWSLIKSSLPLLLGNKQEPYLMPLDHWRYAFTNVLPAKDQETSYQEQLVPESRMIVPTASAVKVDFNKSRPPLLFIAGGADHFIPAALNRANHKKYQGSGSVTDYKEFPGRCHYTLGQPGWEEVADYALNWIRQHTGAA